MYDAGVSCCTVHGQLIELLGTARCGEGPVTIAGQAPPSVPALEDAQAHLRRAEAAFAAELVAERRRGASYGELAARLGWHKTAVVRAVERASRSG